MLDCTIIRDLLPQYNSGTLSQASKDAIELHTLTCPVCAKMLEDQNARATQQETSNLRKVQLRKWIPMVFLVSLALILLTVAALLLPKVFQTPAPAAQHQLPCKNTDWSANVQQQDDSFEVRIFSKDTLLKTLPVEGVYQSALWNETGTYLTICYTISGHSRVCIYSTASRVVRYLDNTFTLSLRYHHNTFSFLSGQGNTSLPMEYTPWLWDHANERLLVYGLGEDAQGWSYAGYFWYSPGDGTVSGITGFDDKFINAIS